MIQLNAFHQTVNIDKGELVGYTFDDHQYIHQKGSPGWRSADTEMFPIIGPTNENNFNVQTPKGDAIQDQHGLLRELSYAMVDQDTDCVVYEKIYVAGTEIKNSKFPAKSTAEFLTWPYNFTFTKTYKLTENQLKISFSISGDTGMPFMLGYHPAFKLHATTPIIKTEKSTISLEDVLAVGNRAYQVADCNKISLEDKKSITIKTEGFNNFMLWTEVPNMICIEPITFYPYAVEQKDLHRGFSKLSKKGAHFSVCIIL